MTKRLRLTRVSSRAEHPVLPVPLRLAAVIKPSSGIDGPPMRGAGFEAKCARFVFLRRRA